MDATGEDETQRTKPECPADPDAALRMAIVAAIEAGDFARAEALLAVLRASRRAPAPVVDLATKRRQGGA